jgi:hypothetical protein
MNKILQYIHKNKIIILLLLIILILILYDYYNNCQCINNFTIGAPGCLDPCFCATGQSFGANMQGQWERQIDDQDRIVYVNKNWDVGNILRTGGWRIKPETIEDTMKTSREFPWPTKKPGNAQSTVNFNRALKETNDAMDIVLHNLKRKQTAPGSSMPTHSVRQQLLLNSVDQSTIALRKVRFYDVALDNKWAEELEKTRRFGGVGSVGMATDAQLVAKTINLSKQLNSMKTIMNDPANWKISTKINQDAAHRIRVLAGSVPDTPVVGTKSPPGTVTKPTPPASTKPCSTGQRKYYVTGYGWLPCPTSIKSGTPGYVSGDIDDVRMAGPGAGAVTKPPPGAGKGTGSIPNSKLETAFAGNTNISNNIIKEIDAKTNQAIRCFKTNTCIEGQRVGVRNALHTNFSKIKFNDHKLEEQWVKHLEELHNGITTKGKHGSSSTRPWKQSSPDPELIKKIEGMKNFMAKNANNAELILPGGRSGTKPGTPPPAPGVVGAKPPPGAGAKPPPGAVTGKPRKGAVTGKPRKGAGTGGDACLMACWDLKQKRLSWKSIADVGTKGSVLVDAIKDVQHAIGICDAACTSIGKRLQCTEAYSTNPAVPCK